MIYIGIDVAKDKHDCFIVNSNGEVIMDVFTITNNLKGFQTLLSAIPSSPNDDIRIGLEATGHYSINLIRFLNDNQLPLVIFNPLQTNLFRKAHTLRKTKTDKTDAKLIALMLGYSDFKPHPNISYHLNELKSLTRHRARIKDQSSKLKISLCRLIDIMFPELPSVVYSLNQKSTYELLKKFPSVSAIANAHLTKLATVLRTSSKGKYGKEKAKEIRSAAKNSIGTNSHALSFELSQTLRLINLLSSEIKAIEDEIKSLMNRIQSPILSVPGISYTLGSIILAEIGDVNRFQTPSQLLAFAGLDPSTYESGKFKATNTRMVKRGSPYLRWALLEAARLIAMRDQTFKNYYHKKRAEGKHYFVARSHTAKKLVRVLFHLLTNDLEFIPQG